MDGGCKTPWIAKKVLDDNKVPVLPYTRYNGKADRYKPWQYTYDAVNDEYICPQGERLRHTTTDRNGKRSYRSTAKNCLNCPCKGKCGANEKGQKVFSTHIWQEYLELVEQIRKTDFTTKSQLFPKLIYRFFDRLRDCLCSPYLFLLLHVKGPSKNMLSFT